MRSWRVVRDSEGCGGRGKVGVGGEGLEGRKSGGWRGETVITYTAQELTQVESLPSLVMRHENSLFGGGVQNKRLNSVSNWVKLNRGNYVRGIVNSIPTWQSLKPYKRFMF